MTDEKRKKDEEYGLGKIRGSKPIPAPELDYKPKNPKSYRPGIGLIGCGGITEHHLSVYKKAGYSVVALCDIRPERAEKRRDEFFPDAKVYPDYRDLLAAPGVEVVDIATHPEDRGPIIEVALKEGKHVLSQKPLTKNLDHGLGLVELANSKNVKLAVNQNGRWAPHFSYARKAIQAGLIGDVIGAHLSVHWDHNWIGETEFNKVKHIILYDFAIHWFDIVTCFMGGRAAKRVYASLTRSPGQTAAPALLGQALIEYDHAQATLSFDADTRFGPQDRTYIAGTEGTLFSVGTDLTKQTVTLYTKDGHAVPELEGSWFPDGFHGAMGELLCAVEEGREPENGAAENLNSLALCFAAVASAEESAPKIPGQVRSLPE